MVVRPTLLYGTECWPVKKNQVRKLMIVEMRMIRWMYGFTRLDKIRNEMIRKKVGVAPIEEKLRETRFRWLGHVKRRGMSALVRRCDAINLIQYRRGRGQPKMSWNEIIRGDMKCIGLTEDIAQDRKLWRAGIRTVVHK